MPMGGDIQDWFKSLPLFTRYWFGGTILFTLLGRFGLLQPAWLVLYLEPLIHRFQVSMLQFMIIAYYYPGKNVIDILFRMFGREQLQRRQTFQEDCGKKTKAKTDL